MSGKHRFRLRTLLIALAVVPIAALLIVAGHDANLMMGHSSPDDDGEETLLLGLIVFLLFTPAFGFLGLLTFIVIRVNRGDPPPRSNEGLKIDHFRFKIQTMMIVVLIIAMVIGAILWLARNSPS